MKKMLFSVLCTMIALCRLQAQNAETHVAVYAGGAPLETLLTEAQKQSVTYLEITGGTLSDKDYAFLRDSLLEQLDTLDLRHAEIDTIPDHAFDRYLPETLCFILPEDIQYVGNSTFSTTNWYTLVITGNYPIFCGGLNTYINHIHIEASDYNKYCKNVIQENEYPYLSVYSRDEEILYFINAQYEGVFEVKSGTKQIHSSAFQGIIFAYQCTLVFPSSIDSIGDYAFKSTGIDMPTRSYSRNYNFPFKDGCASRIICESENPPSLGKDVFYNSFYYDEACLYVPKKSLETYRNTPGWNEAKKIRAIEDIGKGSSIFGGKKTSRLAVQIDGGIYTINSSCEIQSVSCYDTAGRLLPTQTGKNAQSFTMRKANITKPYIMVRVRFADGTTETVKLIP